MALENKRHIALTKEERKAFAKLRLFGFPNNNCPCCGKGKMIPFDSWEANKDPPAYLKVATGKQGVKNDAAFEWPESVLLQMKKK